MSEKLITLSLGGQERTLDVGKFWYTKYYGQVAGEDPLNSTNLLISPERQFDFVVNMVYAGLKCYAKVNKIEFTTKKSDVEDWVGCLEDSQVASIITSYGEVNKSEPGESLALENGALHGTS